MQAYQPTQASLRNISHLTTLATLSATGLILFMFESAIPRPLPWLKPGLANLVVVVALYRYGFRFAIGVMLTRVLAGALLLGSLLNPVFLFSLGGGTIATLGMAFFREHFPNAFSIIGISLIGAFMHNLVQLLLAAFLVVGSAKVFYLAPIMLLSSLFSGFLVGIFAHYVVSKMEVLNV